MVIGKLDKKIVFTKENESRLRWEHEFRADKYKYGDNVYSVIRFLNGNPYKTYNVLMDRDEIVDYFKAGDVIIGLKIDKAGRLIEDPNAVDPNAKAYEKIRKMIIAQATKGQYTLELKHSEEEYTPEEQIVCEILSWRVKPTVWDAFGVILGLAEEIAAQNKMFIGGVYISDEIHNICISASYERVLSFLSSQYQSYCAIQDYDDDYVEERLSLALEDKNRKLLEPWIEFGSFEYSNNYDAAHVLKSAGEIGEDAQYGEVGVWYSEPTSKVATALVERASYDKLSYELKILMKNIKVFRNCRYKANNPQETFKLYTKRAMLGHGNSTQSVSDYIDLALAVQEIYYKNPENIRCEEEGVIVIEKAGIKIERKPYVLTVSKI